MLDEKTRPAQETTARFRRRGGQPAQASASRSTRRARRSSPSAPRARFRRLKWLVMAVTLGIYYVTPWLRWDRGPYPPDQAVLIDLAHRRFYFFCIEIWPHEFYFVAGLLVMAGLGLFLFTSALGRVWCGYACPQTVWTDLFILVERWIEGDRNARIRLDKAPWVVGKTRAARRQARRSGSLIAIATGGAWIFYFADAPTLAARARHRPGAASIAYVDRRHPDRDDLRLRRLHARTGLHLHVPLAAHPGRDDGRGHPDRHLQRLARRAARQARQEGAGAEGEPVGDCIDCMACVDVCPMGIDIRDGQQLACITCALCIDACDDVMDKLGKARPDRLRDAERLQRHGADRTERARRSARARAAGKLDDLASTTWRSIGRAR